MSPPAPHRIIVADDHPMCREAARIAAQAVGPADVVDAANLHDLLADRDPADLIVLDLGLPDSKGIASLVDVARERPGTPILVVSGSEVSDIAARVAAAGAVGFVSKMAPLTELVEAIRTVLDGGTHFDDAMGTTAFDDMHTRLKTLTPAEARVLRAMSGGRLNKQIAHDLGLSEITVKQHISAILRKLGVGNRTQAILARQGSEDAEPSGI